YQCKRCYNHCPYTPPHRWQVDFPRLMLRARSAEARAKGVTLQDRFLGNTALVGRIGSLTSPLSNWASTFPPHRTLMQAMVGIHTPRPPPSSPREPSPAGSAGPPPADFAPQRRVALFATCTVDFNDPATGKAAVAVLERNRVEVSLPAQRCCGMPYL